MQIDKELSRLEKSMRVQDCILIIILILAVLSYYLCYRLGYGNKELEVLRSAKEVTKQNKSCYTSQDIEVVIFGEIQE